MRAGAEAANAFASDTDRGLASATAQGDVAAFRALTNRHVRAVHRLAARMLADAAEADEVTQETFLKLWTNASGWHPRGVEDSVLPWLRTIAMNACIDRLRKRRVESQGEVPDLADERPTAAEQIDRQRHEAIVSTALARISDRHRAAIILTYYEELTNASAAATMKLGLKAFESLLLRARQALKMEIVAAGLGPSDLKDLA